MTTEEIYNDILTKCGWEKSTNAEVLNNWKTALEMRYSSITAPSHFNMRETWISPDDQIAISIASVDTPNDMEYDGGLSLIIGVWAGPVLGFVLSAIPGFAAIDLFAGLTLALDPTRLVEDEE